MSILTSLFRALMIVAGVVFATVAAIAFIDHSPVTGGTFSVLTLLTLYVGRSRAAPAAVVHHQRARWRSDPATAKQKDFARELGIKYWRGITKGELSDLISEAQERRH